MNGDLVIQSSAGPYSVEFAEVGLRRNPRDSEFLIADSFFFTSDRFDTATTIWIDAIEPNKSLGTVDRIICELQRHGLSKAGTVLAVGGGIVQDIATLVASLYMRGVAWEYAPSTLLGMVDSCIGGKSSINSPAAKNLIGNIYPPRRIIIDTSFVSSLPPREICSGLAEALKISFCGGESTFFKMLDLLDANGVDNLTQIVHLSLTTKKWFIETDEFDKSDRLQLNFGHTFGHAIEVSTDFKIPHGLAVAIGMTCAARFAATHKQLPHHVTDLEVACIRLVRDGLEGATKVDFNRERFLEAFRSDKKHPSGSFRLILPGDRQGTEIILMDRTLSLEEELLDCTSAVLNEVLL